MRSVNESAEKPLRMLDDAFADDLGTERVPSILAESNLHQSKKALKTANIKIFAE